MSQITLEGTLNEMIDDINNDVMFAGKPLHTVRLLKQIRISMMISAVIILPASVVLAMYYSPIFVTLNVVWIVLFLFPKMQQSQLSQDRRKKVESELPAFVIFAAVMQNVGINLYECIQLFKRIKLFPAMDKEGLLLKRNVDFFGMSQMEALEELGRTHKSQMFANLLLGYTSIWRSGGDLALYLENRSEEFLVLLKEKYQAYANNVGTIVEVLVTLLIILPILIMVISFVLPGSSIEQITLLAAVGLPAFAMMIGVVISSVQPTSFNKIGLTQNQLAILFGVGFVIGVGLYALGQELWISIAAAFLVPSAISAIIVGRQNKEISKLEEALPQFLRDITEYKKIGYDILLAIVRLSREGYYNQTFIKKLREVAILIDYGTTPTASTMAVSFRPWMTKISFFILSYIAEFGGGSPKILETITRFITSTKQAIREGKSSVSMLTLLVFASPMIMAFTAGIIQNMLGGISDSTFKFAVSNTALSSDSQFGLGSNFVNIVTVTPQFLSMIKTLIVTSSILSAFVITKAVDFTFYNTWRVVVIGLIAVASILAMDAYASFAELDMDKLFEGLPF
ncbi:MAG TPA: type II secretion system F family protein [Candidatus Nitrosotenuis sp.]|nr:type II secretion system F family protein [Candidatus Nitrosotenuis sp.]